MPTSEVIKKKAIEFGADIVGIAPINRFADTSPEKDPRFIAPSAKSVIGLGFRVLRGSFRGVESGTQFYQLPAMGTVHIDMRHAPRVLRRLVCFIEDNGFEGVPQMAENDRRPASDRGTNPEMEQTFKIKAESVGAGKPAPDVVMDFNQAAYLCGLGEMGMGGFILTPEFGPFQRFAFILTDAELEPDPIFAGRICDKCGKCVASCPGHALLRESLHKKWGGIPVEHFKLDEWQCAAYYAGAHSATNPFLPPSAFHELPDGEKTACGEKMLSPKEAARVKSIAAACYGGVGFNYSACICGKSCQRECYIHLEKTGVLRKKFNSQFRTEKPWRIENKIESPYMQK